jgi:hypothetical protein
VFREKNEMQKKRRGSISEREIDRGLQVREGREERIQI